MGKIPVPKSKLPIGIYVKESEFRERKPGITLPFKTVPHFLVRTNEQAYKEDSTEAGVMFEFLDSNTTTIGDIYGFYDGKEMYWGGKKAGYYKFDYVGRFSFATINGFRNPPLLGKYSVSSVINRAIAKPHDMVFYFNKNQKWIEATGQSIGWLLKNDKDFIDDFNAEKKYGNEVFKKYLVKMNERYPE